MLSLWIQRFAYAVGLLLWLGGSVAGASESESDKEELLSRALGHMHFAQGLKHGFRTEVRAAGRTSSFIEAVLATDDASLERVVARVYARRLSIAEVQTVASFYESEAGQALVRQQAQDPLNPRPKIELTSDQMARALAFSRSSTGRKLAEVMDSNEAWVEIDHALRALLK
jgi:hypothetical protein